MHLRLLLIYLLLDCLVYMGHGPYCHTNSLFLWSFTGTHGTMMTSVKALRAIRAIIHLHSEGNKLKYE